MQKDQLPNIHPGELLRLDFLEPLKITPYRLSKDIGVAQTRIGEILAGKRSISADTAWRLSRYFSNSPQFWMNLQTQYDLREAQEENSEGYAQITAVQRVIVERDLDTNLYVGYVPGIPGAHSQGKTLHELKTNLHEVIDMLFDDEGTISDR